MATMWTTRSNTSKRMTDPLSRRRAFSYTDGMLFVSSSSSVVNNLKISSRWTTPRFGVSDNMSYLTWIPVSSNRQPDWDNCFWWYLAKNSLEEWRRHTISLRAWTSDQGIKLQRLIFCRQLKWIGMAIQWNTCGTRKKKEYAWECIAY